MRKVMLFIDGTWLYCNAPRLAQFDGTADFRVDFGKLPTAIVDAIAKQLGVPLDLVRVHLYGSYAVNHDQRDDEAVRRRRDFFSLVRDEFRYDIETYPINFMGRPVRRADREPRDTFEPRENVVDVALATGLTYWASMSGACDICVVLSGNQDIRPALKRVRKLGKRVALASIRDACSPVLADPRNDAGYLDFDTVWLDEMLDQLELVYTQHTLVCEASGCGQEVWTTFHPRRGQRFYCDECRAAFGREPTPAEGEGALAASPGEFIVGVVRRKISDRGYGFIEIEDGRQYFFHLSDLNELSFDDLTEGEEVEFEVKRVPANGQAGAAQSVRGLERL